MLSPALDSAQTLHMGAVLLALILETGTGLQVCLIEAVAMALVGGAASFFVFPFN